MGLAHRILLLVLFGSSVAMATPNVPREHVVQSGQTLAKIAKRYRIELDALCAANDLKKSAKLQPGLRLSLPSDNDVNDVVPQKPSSAAVHDSRAGGKRSEGERHVLGKSTSYGQYLTRPTRRGWVHIMGHHGEWQGQLLTKNGKLLPKGAIALSRLLAWPRNDFSMNPRLLLLLAQVSDAFGGRILRVVSGYRTTSYAAESKHPLGRACDFHVLGVPNTALRDFAKTFDNVGVGYYPNSTFIHLDARDHDAYWVDYAGPGEPPRMTPHRVARATDDAPMNAARTAAGMKTTDEIAPEAEAEADVQSRQEEHRETKDESSPANTASKTKALGRAAGPANVPHSSVAAEPESASERPIDSASVTVDL